MTLLETIWLVVRKDLLIEFRSREIVYTTLFFAVSVMLVFSFSFVREGVAVEGAAPGILWVAIAFSGTLALGRAFERERQNETLRGLLMSPAERPALYLGKLGGIMLLLVAVEVVTVPLVAFMFQAPLFRYPALMAGAAADGHARLCRRRDAVCGHAGADPQPGRAAAAAALSDHRARDHRRRARNGGAAAGRRPTSRWPAPGSRCWCSSTSSSSRSRYGRSRQ